MDNRHIEIIIRALKVARHKGRLRLVSIQDKDISEGIKEELAEYDEVLDLLESQVESTNVIKKDNLEAYLQNNLDKGIIDHVIRADRDESGAIKFYIHAVNADSNIQDFVVLGNRLTALK